MLAKTSLSLQHSHQSDDFAKLASDKTEKDEKPKFAKKRWEKFP
jgi:hypothetical protein